MRIEFKRRFAAWLLLSVFVPMTVLVALHHHDGGGVSETELCYSCVHHVHHAGHVNTPQADIHDCVLCQLHCVSFLAAALTVFAAAGTGCETVRHGTVRRHLADVYGVFNPRAPPYILSC